jgi:aspartyl-tRNA(Asn)/glutamyl-tRNA(Gln) amidotransferase subunit C
MAITREDVLHIADLARLGIDSARADALTRELSAILAHMDVLSQVDTSHVAPAAESGTAGTPLRSDDREAPLMEGVLESFAPSMRDGFFIVPRLSTHEDPVEDGA